MQGSIGSASTSTRAATAAIGNPPSGAGAQGSRPLRSTLPAVLACVAEGKYRRKAPARTR